MIGRFRRYADEHGARRTAQRVVLELGRFFYRVEHVTLLLKELDDIVTPVRLADLVVEALEERHLSGLSELNRRRGFPEGDRRFRNQLDRGLHGFVGLREDEIIGYYWWVDCGEAGRHHDLDWLGDSLQIEPGDVYGSDFYLLPDHRGGGTAGTFLYHVESRLAQTGFARLWGYVDQKNRPARWLYSSRGYLSIRDLIIRRILMRRQITEAPK